jgi:hypothetical protein
MSPEKSNEELVSIIRDMGARIGAYQDDVDTIRRKVVEHIQTAPRPKFPVTMPDGVVYDGPGSVIYPQEHLYSKMSQVIDDLSHESPYLQKRFEQATGFFLADGGARYSPIKAFLKRVLYVATGKCD